MTLTQQQQSAVLAINRFVDDSNSSVFILKGYAGTGKTTIIKSLIPLLESKRKCVTLMAPTGRAAKVLGDKTGRGASTIHHAIHSFQNMKLNTYDNEVGDSLHYWFAIKSHKLDYVPSDNIYIIDESSMISSRHSATENYHFGTDVLIDDLLTYASIRMGGKIIFVGDPAQLPPVGDNNSVALDVSFFTHLNIGVTSFELTEVLRQKGESVILKNAMMIRNLLARPVNERNCLNFERKKGEVEDIIPSHIPQLYCKMYPKPSIGDTIVVCFSNSMVKEYNDAIRCNYFPETTDVTVGDILMVVKNIINEDLSLHYFNGDFVKVIEVSDKVEKQSAAVWTDGNNNKREQVTVSLYYRDVVLQSEDGTRCSCKIVDNLLNSCDATLTPVQTLAAYINFVMRHSGLKPNTEAFVKALNSDPYFNAVQVKYGYAITGHKSQGGEWKTVFLDYSGRTGLNNDSLRWNYTATTRARNTIYGVEMPRITPVSQLRFTAIKKISKPSKEAFSYADVKGLENIMPTAKAFQKQKYLSVKAHLDKLGYIISGVTFLIYNDHYRIETPKGTILYNCYYNASLMYSRYYTDSQTPECKAIDEAFNDESAIEYDVRYSPSSAPLLQLYNKMMSLCDDLDITVTNIVEHTDQYYVTYYLKTSGKYSQLQFYFKSNGAFSSIMPSSDIGNNDEALVRLMNALKR